MSLPLARHGVIAVSSWPLRVDWASSVPRCYSPAVNRRRTLAVQLYILHEQPGYAYEQRLWRLVTAAIVLSCAALAASEYLERRGAQRDSA